jgi:hypothetical protein
MEQYDVVLRGRSALGRRNVQNLGSLWTVVGEEGPNVLLVSPPTMPTLIRAVRKVGDSNFEVVRPDPPGQ